jgi:5-enolpyruvylshikimate-3-phosphate synthase
VHGAEMISESFPGFVETLQSMGAQIIPLTETAG